ncbi:hypothetical protein MTP03_01270 [Tsukamurella sp. PLM1]|nr:hypothetical protein MTP03_01270 [Tsukamurella sp. PLM1]
MGRRERNATPREGSNRAEKLAAQRARAEAGAAAGSRPFEGMASECDIVALRQFVPSATAPLKVAGANREVRLATVLPGASYAMVREEDDGVVGYAALQTSTRPAEPGAALAGAARFAADAPVGEALAEPVDGALLEVLDAAAPLEITVHKDFDWWLSGDVDASTRQLVEQANSLITPAARIDLGADGVGAPWWADTGSKAHLRWVHPAPEDELMAARRACTPPAGSPWARARGSPARSAPTACWFRSSTSTASRTPTSGWPAPSNWASGWPRPWPTPPNSPPRSGARATACAAGRCRCSQPVNFSPSWPDRYATSVLRMS